MLSQKQATQHCLVKHCTMETVNKEADRLEILCICVCVLSDAAYEDVSAETEQIRVKFVLDPDKYLGRFLFG